MAARRRRPPPPDWPTLHWAPIRRRPSQPLNLQIQIQAGCSLSRRRRRRRRLRASIGLENGSHLIELGSVGESAPKCAHQAVRVKYEPTSGGRNQHFRSPSPCARVSRRANSNLITNRTQLPAPNRWRAHRVRNQRRRHRAQVGTSHRLHLRRTQARRPAQPGTRPAGRRRQRAGQLC